MSSTFPNDSAISVGGSQALPNPTNDTRDSPAASQPEPAAPSAEQQAQQYAVGEDAVNQAQNSIDVDDSSESGYDDGASDPGYDSASQMSASTSLSSSVRDYLYENGRRYHAFREGTYNFPNDDTEQEREDLKHAMMSHLLNGRLHYAPIGPAPQNIMDIGTGTGIWAIEMGDLYPSATVTGVDLSPIQPEWVPPNVKFMVDDVESEWLRPANFFDYVHSRHTVMGIRDWPRLMRSVLHHLTPGGWYEMQEIHHVPYCHDGTMPADHPVNEYWHYIVEALAALGVNFNATLLLEDMMREAGFVNVHVRIFHVPIGVWPRNTVLKRVGLYWRTVLLDGAEPIALGPLSRGLGWTKEQIDLWLVKVRKAYMDTWCHSHMPLFIICGQKPGPGVIEYGPGQTPPWADVPIS